MIRSIFITLTFFALNICAKGQTTSNKAIITPIEEVKDDKKNVEEVKIPVKVEKKKKTTANSKILEFSNTMKSYNRKIAEAEAKLDLVRKENRDLALKALDSAIKEYTKNNQLKLAELLLKYQRGLISRTISFKYVNFDKQVPAEIRRIVANYRTKVNAANSECYNTRKKLAEETVAILNEFLKVAISEGNAKRAVLVNNKIEYLRNQFISLRSNSKNAKELKKGEISVVTAVLEKEIISARELPTTKARNRRYANKIEIPDRSKDNNLFGLMFEGYFFAEKSGKYTFSMTSDDGSIFWLCGREFINIDFCHPKCTVVKTIDLPKGWHPIKVFYFQNKSSKEFSLYYKEGDKFVDIPSHLLAH